MIKKLAAIDIGTNSIHLVIAEVDEESGKFSIIGKEREPVRLGSGSSDMKYLKEDAMLRGIETLIKFKGLADSAGAPVRAIATSAVREAKNQDEFINRVRDAAGIKVEVASGIEEARYIYLGVLQALPVFSKHILLIDIGGGSTEFLVGFRRDVYYDNSIKLGAVRLTNRFFSGDKIEKSQIKECTKFIRGILQPVIRDISIYSWETVIGSSGTVLTLANMIKLMRGDTPGRLNNFSFTSAELEDIVKIVLSAKTVKELKKLPGLDQSRADIITAGAIILEQIFSELGIKKMICSEYALREGLIYDTMESVYSGSNGYNLDNIRLKSVLHIARSFHYEKEHSHHTAELALKIFDELKKIHKLGYNQREYLHAAGLLHEVGCFVSHSQHHRHSYYIIRNSELLGFNENEKEIIANIARYHRKSHPKSKHPEFVKLQEEDKKIIRILAGILRIADGLDRTHSSAVKDIKCTVDDNTVTFSLVPADNSATLELEIWGAELKQSLFEYATGFKTSYKIININS